MFDLTHTCTCILGGEGPDRDPDLEVQGNGVEAGTGQGDQGAWKGEDREAEIEGDRDHAQEIEGAQEVQEGGDREVETEDEAGQKVENDEGMILYFVHYIRAHL